MRQMLMICWVVSSLSLLGCQRTPYPAHGPNDLSPLVTADRFEIYSLNGKVEPPPPTDAPEKDGCFHGYPILGRAEVVSESERRRLLDALQDGMNRPPPAAAGCFWPGHGLRVVSGSISTDYVICFKCLQVRIYSGSKREHLLISADPRKVLDDYLIARGEPVATEP
jgi:hypothetical protein